MLIIWKFYCGWWELLCLLLKQTRNARGKNINQLSNMVKHGVQTFIKLFHHSWQGEMSPSFHGYEEIGGPLVNNNYEVIL